MTFLFLIAFNKYKNISHNILRRVREFNLACRSVVSLYEYFFWDTVKHALDHRPFCTYAQSLRVEIAGRCLSLQIVIPTKVFEAGLSGVTRNRAHRERLEGVRESSAFTSRMNIRWSGQFVGCMRRGIIFVPHARKLF